ncbi:glycine zipper domain-containing protein [Aequorivita sp. SDUM287046]|uniref:Glycine zipper domain-containing protein n=1 Tax=Aequorivita aurantiaca TaxID=3053356 RepID=A0ABT8DE50_9FLAO|nr:glycine zipper domain-containing protein [Aequorivita aurantiaca]MDN3723551.1 glycine zipper domain-containing protein [Aequorivita aurantiaca]
MKKIIFTSILLLFQIGISFGTFAQSAGEAVAKKMSVYVFPTKNQSAEQQAQDQSACYTWAVEQSGYDPINPTVVKAQQVPTGPDGAAVVGSAGGAAVGVAIGAIAGDAGKGAAIGAVSGAVVGRRRGNMQKASAQNQANNQAAQANKNLEDGFRKAFSACLEAKNYTVK